MISKYKILAFIYSFVGLLYVYIDFLLSKFKKARGDLNKEMDDLKISYKKLLIHHLNYAKK